MTLVDAARWLHGLLYAFPLLVAAWAYMVFIFPPLSLLLVFKPTRYYFHFIRSLVFDVWKYLAALSLEWFTLTKIRITLDDKTKLSNESTLFISNHPTHLDWHPMLCLSSRCNQNRKLRMVIKDELRMVPVGGWAWQLGMYIFLNRNDKEKDVAWLAKCMQHWKDSGMAASWVVFPEGTAVSPACVAKSQEYARKQGLQVYDYVLHPRTAGFISMLQHGRSHLDAVYDITMAYQYFAKGERPNEMSYLKGRFPPVVHMHVKRYAIDELPTDDEELAAWCKERWAEKEAMLEQAYNKGSHSSLTLPGKPLPEANVLFKFVFALVVNTVLTGYFLSLLASWPWVIYATVMSVTWQVVGTYVGVDRLLVALDW
eukprot:m.158779 g.158779  ORF g.158779 m.158779 type:complete len:370 (+) comp16476_c0_seq1:152-1261(+)